MAQGPGPRKGGALGFVVLRLEPQGGEGTMWLQGGSEEAPGRLQGGNGALGGLAYEVLRTSKRRTKDLTHRWARGPANLKANTHNVFGP